MKRAVTMVSLLVLGGGLALCGGGCAGRHRAQGPLDVAVGAWQQGSGQAVWTPSDGGGEVVVDLHWWEDSAGSCRLEVSKAGLPFLSLQVSPEGWSVTPPSGRRRSGRAPVPIRAGWLQLACVLAGRSPRPPWQWQPTAAGTQALRRVDDPERWEVMVDR